MSTAGPRRGTPLGTELLFDDPCVVFALRSEAKAFRRTFRPQQRFAGAPCWAKFCGPGNHDGFLCVRCAIR